ncbi:MAG: hypothetical protein ACXWHZ_11165 [Usitatibacter sp.]
MKHQELFLTAAIAASVALSAPMVNAGQANSPDARALAAAQEGPTALRHFVDRTRMIYALNYSDYSPAAGQDTDIDADSDGDAAAGPSFDGVAAPDSNAQAPSAARQKDLDEAREQLYRDMLRE